MVPLKTHLPILSDPTQTFALGLARLALAVRHLPSSIDLWRAPTDTAHSIYPTLSFNGSLVLSVPHLGLLWSIPTSFASGDRVLLLNDSNLQIQNTQDSNFPIWESFDSPSVTLVASQNFTANQSLVSGSGRFSMRVGADSFGLFADFGGDTRPMYYTHKAMEIKAQIVSGAGPVYLRVSPHGFLGMYQSEAAPVDVLNFDTFNHNFSGDGEPLRRLTLEDDGNLRGYYYNGSTWVGDFQAISDTCQLPSACGPEVIEVGDERKVGYFKVKLAAEERRRRWRVM
ncbi:PAN domain-containing protein [Acorus gramineus]|uniref:PAN domain-containing protein n=1 Tax=Acorus gramineus TaxID=55184 RepID=A0AAV9BJG6_ACOGR|nr:PAN domain-containing protein [Acorus gramineus]